MCSQRSSLDPKRWPAPSRAAFTLIELLVVVAIIAILASILVPTVRRALKAGQAAHCKSNLHQLALAMIMYSNDHNDYLPWAGEVDGNRDGDWVWGGQDNTYPDDPQQWLSPQYGFHPEPGSIFPYATKEDRVTRDEFNSGFEGRTKRTRAHPVYRCPGTGPIGAALRVTYSMNAMLKPGRTLSRGKQVGPEGVSRIEVTKPTKTLLLVDEDPSTNRNASFYPGGSASRGVFTTHGDYVNVGFVDGHVNMLTHVQVMEIQRSDNRAIWFDPF